MPDFVYELPVRYADTDAQGHVFFANYLTFYDEALTAFFAHLGCPYADLEREAGAMFVYASAQSDYRGRTFFGDRVQIAVSVESVGNSSLVTRHRATTAPGRLVAEGRLVSVCLDVHSRQKRPLPDRLRAALLTPLG